METSEHSATGCLCTRTCTCHVYMYSTSLHNTAQYYGTCTRTVHVCSVHVRWANTYCTCTCTVQMYMYTSRTCTARSKHMQETATVRRAKAGRTTPVLNGTNYTMFVAFVVSVGWVHIGKDLSPSSLVKIIPKLDTLG